ncbi:MAG: Hpt domain-containing protein [Thermodesulfobacteriota bacterium]|nr:Hpt domain-containing protein [Thermodesulfobacteriota bacterium]
MTQNNDTERNEKIIIHVDPDIEDLIPGFLENRRRDIETIEDSLASNDYETIQRLGHSMKGAGGGYGFDEITDIGLHIENAAKEKNADEIQRQAGKLLNYLENIEVVYE